MLSTKVYFWAIFNYCLFAYFVDVFSKYGPYDRENDHGPRMCLQHSMLFTDIRGRYGGRRRLKVNNCEKISKYKALKRNNSTKCFIPLER